MVSKLKQLPGFKTATQAAQNPWLFFVALLILYTAWLGYVISRDKPLDFYVYYLAAETLARGQSPYTITNQDWAALASDLHIVNYTSPYQYPLLTALLVWPLTYLSPQLAAACWFIANAGALILSAWWLGCASGRPYGAALALGLLLFYVPPLTTLQAGQVNGLLLLTLCGALYAFKRGQPAWAGAGLAVGVMLKLTPTAHLAYLLWRRQWRAAIIGLLVISLLLGVTLPLMSRSDLMAYSHHLVSLGGAIESWTSGASQSLTSFFARWLTSEEGRWSLVDAPQWARRLAWGASLILVAATAALCWPRGNVVHCFPLEFALVTISISLVTPYVWYHQLVVLLIPFFVLTESALINPARRWWLWPLGIGYGLTDIHGLTWHYLDPYPLLSSTPFYTMIMMWGMLAWLISRDKKFRFNSKSV